ncbi:pyridoxal phosphate-dependent decarboxylase family protein, partial [candidate division KSB1 bacterium]
YLTDPGKYPVLSKVKPGEIKGLLPEDPPEDGEDFRKILDDFNEKIMPGVTHWNHPNFYAYFAITGTKPGILGEILSQTLNINGMLWKTCPSSTELEEVVVNWAKKLMNIPEEFFGLIVDTASVSTLNAIVAARENCRDLNVRVKGFSSIDNTRLRLYCSDQTHSSIDKAAIISGIGLENVCKIETEDNFRMIPEKFEERIKTDIGSGYRPFAAVATIGTTSTTGVDPVPEIGKICRKYDIWLHVDGAYAGTASIIPEFKYLMDGFENVDSYVFNPHKWLGVPFDASLLYVRNEDILKKAFSIIPEYLTTAESGTVTDYMNYGPQLGRRFRAIKLWFVLRYFGKNGIISRLRGHIRFAQLFKSKVEHSVDFEIMAPVPFSVICFRLNPSGKNLNEEEIEKINTKLMNEVNKTGKIYISHSKLKGKYTLRFAIGNFKTTENDVISAWDLIEKTAMEL